MKKFLAFTLSETLITLVIIGVVSAITMPSLIASWQKTRTVECLKKAYSTLSQTTNRAIADNGPISGWEVLGLSGKEFADIYLKPYLNIMRDKSSERFEYTTLNNIPESKNYHTFYLLDGTKIGVSPPFESEWGISINIFVDINGDAKPNKMGRDVFFFIYWPYNSGSKKASGTFIPYGGNFSRYNCINGDFPYTCRKDKTGELCAALIMKDNWQIKEDYPW